MTELARERAVDALVESADLDRRSVDEKVPATTPDLESAVVEIEVRDWQDLPFVGASVLVTDRRILAPLGSQEAAAELADAVVTAHVDTDHLGRAVVACPSGHHHVRVESKEGVPATTGPLTIVVAAGRMPVQYRVGRVLAAAVRLMDGSTALHTRWGIECAYGLGLEPGAVRQARERLAETLEIPVVQAFAGLAREPGVEPDGVDVQLYHERIGWFTARVPIAPIGEVGAATLVAVPERGTAAPVRLTVRCFDPAGRSQKVEGIMLSGGRRQGGYDGVSDIFGSDSVRLVPPGVYILGFKDAALANACSQRIAIEHDRIVDVQVPFLPIHRQLVVTCGGRPYRGEISARVQPNERRGSHRVFTLGRSDGTIRLSLVPDVDNTIEVRAAGKTKTLVFKSGDVRESLTCEIDS